ncbi:MAG TPA: hypothetical protein VHW00_21035 [Thermoanaerobaculia bacterium]|nr:hypothetical protein [Thermoanaerobaculia bacterium]
MKKVLLALLLSLVVVPLFAVEVVAIDPIGPTSRDRITFLIPLVCGGETISVNRVENVFTVRMNIYDVLCDPPIRNWHEVQVEPLPPGTYRVDILRQQGDALYARATFVVRNAEPKTFELHPSIVDTDAANPPLIRVTRPSGDPICATETCEDVEIRVGGTKVTAVQDTNGTHSIWFTPPARSTAGYVSLEVQHGDAIELQPAALYYVETIEPSLFEHILYPVLTDTTGLNGSHWISEAVIANPNPFRLSTASNIAPIVCVTSPCGTERLGSSTYFPFRGEAFPHGAFLLVPRDEASLLSYSLRIRDTSRVQEGFGTNIPVVRERDMSRTQPLSLIDIPRDPRYRVKLRVYAILPEGRTDLGVGLRTVVDSRTYNDIEYSNLVLEGPGNPIEPAYGELDLPAGRDAQRSLIFVDPSLDALTWAFITVTNNETQQVTIIVPNGSGSPCPTCGQR